MDGSSPKYFIRCELPTDRRNLVPSGLLTEKPVNDGIVYLFELARISKPKPSTFITFIGKMLVPLGWYA